VALTLVTPLFLDNYLPHNPVFIPLLWLDDSLLTYIFVPVILNNFKQLKLLSCAVKFSSRKSIARQKVDEEPANNF